jgi:hypothetical protein
VQASIQSENSSKNMAVIDSLFSILSPILSSLSLH